MREMGDKSSRRQSCHFEVVTIMIEGYSEAEESGNICPPLDLSNTPYGK